MYEHALGKFTRKIISDYLSQGQLEERSITNLMERFLESLKKEQLIYGAEVLLAGIVLRPDTVELGQGLILRRLLGGFGRAFFLLYSIPSRHSPYPRPTAIFKNRVSWNWS